MAEPFSFLGKKVGPSHPVLTIADIGLNHNGSVAIAKQLIVLAAQGGFDVVKFQKRYVDNLATKEVLDAPDDRFPEFGKTYREIREHLEFDKAEYEELIACARANNIKFLCTPFDIESAKFLEDLGIEAYKVASHSLTNMPLLNFLASLGKPVVLSTGMSTLEEVDRGVRTFTDRNIPLILTHCVSAYPTPPELANLALINFYKQRYRVPVGYSGHEHFEERHLPSLGAVFCGADVVERHITMDVNLPGFDHRVSVSAADLFEFIKNIHHTRRMIGNGIKELHEKELVARDKYHISIISKVDIPSGTLITAEMLTFKNPGVGIESYDIDKVIGRIAATDIVADSIIKWDMLK